MMLLCLQRGALHRIKVSGPQMVTAYALWVLAGGIEMPGMTAVGREPLGVTAFLTCAFFSFSLVSGVDGRRRPVRLRAKRARTKKRPLVKTREQSVFKSDGLMAAPQKGAHPLNGAFSHEGLPSDADGCGDFSAGKDVDSNPAEAGIRALEGVTCREAGKRGAENWNRVIASGMRLRSNRRKRSLWRSDKVNPECTVALVVRVLMPLELSWFEFQVLCRGVSVAVSIVFSNRWYICILQCAAVRSLVVEWRMSV